VGILVLTRSLLRRAGRAAGSFALLAVGAIVLPPVQAQQPLAVVVNPDNPMASVTSDGLRGLYLGTTRWFGNGQRVALYEQTALRDVFYGSLLRMDAAQVKRYWVGRVFSEVGVIPPKSVADASRLLEIIGKQRGAIGFLDARSVDASVKVVAVDGLLPSDARYPLHMPDTVPNGR
jgi:hypothetical protein